MGRWCGHRSYTNGDAIYFWDGDPNHQAVNLTINDSINASRPQIADGQVVWFSDQYTQNSREIYFWDGVNGVRQLSDNTTIGNVNPRIANGQVVWVGYDGNDAEIYFWDGANGVRQLSNNTIRNTSSQIAEGQVVWQGYDGNDYEIYLWDGDPEHPPINLSNNDGINDYAPQIDGGKVVWMGRRQVPVIYDDLDHGESPPDIYFWDGAEVYRLTNQDDDPDYYSGYWNPQIDNGQVVWHADRGIFFWDGVREHPPVNLSQAYSSNVRSPQIDNGQVVWQGEVPRDNDNYDPDLGFDDEIYLWDGVNVHRLTDNDIEDTNPRIDNGQVVWRGSDEHIYYYKP